MLYKYLLLKGIIKHSKTQMFIKKVIFDFISTEKKFDT